MLERSMTVGTGRRTEVITIGIGGWDEGDQRSGVAPAPAAHRPQRDHLRETSPDDLAVWSAVAGLTTEIERLLADVAGAPRAWRPGDVAGPMSAWHIAGVVPLLGGHAMINSYVVRPEHGGAFVIVAPYDGLAPVKTFCRMRMPVTAGPFGASVDAYVAARAAALLHPPAELTDAEFYAVGWPR